MKNKSKKYENSIVRALNDVCESLKNEITGFTWLTHFVDHTHFPQSLKLVFVFDTDTHLDAARNNLSYTHLCDSTTTALRREDISIKNIEHHIIFDSEENGADVDSIKWCRKYA